MKNPWNQYRRHFDEEFGEKNETYGSNIGTVGSNFESNHTYTHRLCTYIFEDCFSRTAEFISKIFFFSIEHTLPRG